MKLFKIPKLVPLLFRKRVWGFSVSNNSVFLTFDDGPNPELTPKILAILQQHQIKATFFCVGENVKRYPALFEQIKAEGHQVGNHSMYHKNAFKTSKKDYLASIEEADQYIHSKLFRPPYGRMPLTFGKTILKKYQIIMWSWLSYDFDAQVTIEKILSKAEKQIKAGDILVLHDNPKVVQKQQVLLPKLIEVLQKKGFTFDVIKA